MKASGNCSIITVSSTWKPVYEYVQTSAERYTSFITERAKQRHQKMRQEIHQAVLQLKAEGINPSWRNVSLLLGKTVCAFRRHPMASLREARHILLSLPN